MARISLLFSLAFALAIGSLLLSVSGHAPPAPLKKTLCPKTVSELQTLPFTEITKILKQKEKFAPKTAEFKAMFTMSKGYIAYLESLYKFEKPIVDVLGIAKIKYALMTKVILEAQASVSVKVDKKTSLKLKKSCAGLIKGFLTIQKTIVKISAKHDFNANAKINVHESKIIGDAVLNFKSSISAFVDVVCDLEKKKTKKVGLHARTLEEDDDEDRRERAKNDFERFLEKFADKFGGYLGGKTHGRELTEAEFNANSHVGADVKGFETIYENFSQFFGGYLGGDSTHGRELTEAKVGVNAGAQTGVIVNGRFEKFSKFFNSFLRGNAHGRKLVEAQAGVKAGAQANVAVESTLDKFTQFFGSFLGSNHGRELTEARVNAAGKMRFAGKDGFRSRNRAPYKLFVSTRA